VISQAIYVMVRYSDSLDDHEAVPCFFDFQEIDYQVIGQLAQSASKYVCNFKRLTEESKILVARLI